MLCCAVLCVCVCVLCTAVGLCVCKCVCVCVYCARQCGCVCKCVCVCVCICVCVHNVHSSRLCLCRMHSKEAVCVVCTAVRLHVGVECAQQCAIIALPIVTIKPEP